MIQRSNHIFFSIPDIVVDAEWENPLFGADFVQVSHDRGIDVDWDDRWLADCTMVRYVVVLHGDEYDYFGIWYNT